MTPTNVRPHQRFATNPLFFIAVSFAVGIALARAVEGYAGIWLTAACGFGLLTIASTSVRLRGWMILAAFVFTGAFSLEASRVSVPANDLGRLYDAAIISDRSPVAVAGTVSGTPEASPDGYFIRLRADTLVTGSGTQSVSGMVRVFVPFADETTTEITVASGDRIDVLCEITRASEFRNPGAPRRSEILDSQGLDATCSLKRGVVPTINLAAEPAWTNLVSLARSMLVRRFLELFEPRTAGILNASLLGNKNFLDRETARLFREGGTFHILVISGLHVTVIGGFVLYVVRRLTRRRWIQFIASSALLWAFGFAVGGEIPVVRAAMMFTAVLAARLLFRRLEPLNGLGFCALALLAYHPEELFDRSFQMTFLSMYALTGFAFPLLGKLRAIGEWRPDPSTPFPPVTDRFLRFLCETIYWRDHRWKFESGGRIWSARLSKNPLILVSSRPFLQTAMRWMFEGAIVSFVMQIWMLPVSALFFNRISFSAVASNLWVGALIGVETVLALLTVAVAAASSEAARPLAAIVEMINRLLLWLPAEFYRLDLAGTRVPAYGGAGIAVYIVFFAPLLVLTVAAARWRPVSPVPFQCRKRSHLRIVRLSIMAIAALSIVMSTTPFSRDPADGRLHVDFIDVGQGDSSLLTFPDGTLMLVDGGGRPDFSRRSTSPIGGIGPFEPDRPSIGETVVSRFLWSRGISGIDYVVATHADADHIEGLTDVVANFRVGLFLAGRFPGNDENFTRLSRELFRRSVPMIDIGRGDSMRIGGATVEFLHPETDQTAIDSAGNNDSVVIGVTFGKRRILLTGDIEREAERDLVMTGNLRADVVKAPHHGSKTSSTQAFVDATRAAFVVIPVGLRSPYGHPNEEVVRRWRESGSETITTGENGAISVVTDGSQLKIETFVRPP